MSEIDQTVSQDELSSLGGDIIQERGSAPKIAYIAFGGNFGFEPPKSVGLTLGTAIPEAAFETSDTE